MEHLHFDVFRISSLFFVDKVVLLAFIIWWPPPCIGVIYGNVVELNSLPLSLHCCSHMLWLVIKGMRSRTQWKSLGWPWNASVSPQMSWKRRGTSRLLCFGWLAGEMDGGWLDGWISGKLWQLRKTNSGLKWWESEMMEDWTEMLHQGTVYDRKPESMSENVELEMSVLGPL